MLIENLLFLSQFFLSFLNLLPPESFQSNKEKEKKKAHANDSETELSGFWDMGEVQIDRS